MSTLTLWLASALGAIVLSAGACWYSYGEGSTAGEAKVQRNWDAAKQKADAERDAQRADANQLAAQYETDLANLRKRYAASANIRRKSATTSIVCPPSGTIGDLVIPSAVVRGMFNVLEQPSGTGTPGPAASEPADTVR